MSITTEIEIFDCLATNLRKAAEDCRLLAWHPRRGFVYARFIKALGLVEGACRQAYYWRDFDARWLMLALKMHEAQKRAGNWLRDYTSKDGRKVAHPMFVKLGDVLDEAYRLAMRVKTMATFRIGPIMPEPLPGPHRDSRPAQVMLPTGYRVTPGGILLPIAA